MKRNSRRKVDTDEKDASGERHKRVSQDGSARLPGSPPETPPDAEEGISYRIPVFKCHGPLVFFAAYEDHCSLFVPSKAIVASFSSELRGYYNSGATIHFTPDHPLPASLVKKIVRAKLQDNLLRVLLKHK